MKRAKFPSELDLVNDLLKIIKGTEEYGVASIHVPTRPIKDVTPIKPKALPKPKR